MGSCLGLALYVMCELFRVNPVADVLELFRVNPTGHVFV